MRLILWVIIMLSTQAVAETAPAELKRFNGLKTDIPIGKVGDVELSINIALPKKERGKKLAEPGPMIVLIHGGGLMRGDKDKFDDRIAKFADRGIAAASVMYRFAPQYRFPAPIEDVQAAVRFIKANAKTYHIDPERIVLFGNSAGAYLASMVGVTGNVKPEKNYFSKHNLYPEFDSTVAAVVAFSGSPVDFSLPEYQDFFLVERFISHDITDRKTALAAMSATTYLDKNDPPFFLVHGTADEVASASMSRDFAADLKAAGVPHHYMEIEGAKHSLKDPRPEEAKKAFRAAMQFIMMVVAPQETS